MSFIKKTFKFIGVLLILILLILILIPYLFKDKIVDQVRTAINENVNASVDFRDVSLSLIKDFPNLKVDVSDISVIGKGDFKGQKLFSASSTAVSMDIWSLFNESPYKLNNVSVDGAEINVLILKNGLANYDIAIATPPTAEATPPVQYVLELDHYSLTNSDVSYSDQMLNLHMTMKGINHTGSGDFTQDIFDLDTHTEVDALSISMENMSYLKNVKTTADAKINMDLPNLLYTLKDNKIFLNQLELTGNGKVQLVGDDMVIDANMKAPNNEFKEFLSVIPNAYTKGYEDVKTKGTADISATIKGRYSEAQGLFPLIKMRLNILDAYVKYPELPQDISDINIDLNLETFDAKMNTFLLDIPQFKMRTGVNPISGKFRADGSTTNPKFDGILNGLIDLKVISQAFPMADVNEMTGTIDADFSLVATMNDILENNFNALKFTGSAVADNINIQYASYPKVNIPNAKMSASPAVITMDAQAMKLGKSDLSVNGSLKNPLAYVLADKSMQSDIIVRSNKFDANEWMLVPNETDETTAATSTFAIDSLTESIIVQAKINYDVEMNEILYDTYKIQNMKSKGKIAANNVEVNTLKAKVNESDFSMNGNLINAYSYMMYNDTLRGSMTLNADYINANEFMTVSETEIEGEAVSYDSPIIPKNIAVLLSTNINKMTYTNLDFENIIGSMTIQNGDVNMENVSTKALGGNMKFDGLYSSSNPEKPNFSFKYNMADIKFNETFQKLLTVKQLAPIMKFVDGLFNSTLVMSGDLGPGMMPDLSTLNASGFIETLNGVVNGLAPVEKLSEKLGLSDMKKISIENTKNWFEIKDGKVQIQEFDYNYKDIAMKIGGSHSITNDMNYHIYAAIPREMLKSNAIANAANTGLSLLEKEASKIGLNIDQGDFINMDISIGGSITNPKISIRPVSSGGVSLKDAAKQEIEANIDEIKKDATEKITKKITETKDTISNEVNKQIDSLKIKAEQKAAEAAQKAKDEIKNKVTNKADSLVTQVLGDSTKTKVLDAAKDVLGDGTKEKVDNIKDEIKNWNPFKKKKGN